MNNNLQLLRNIREAVERAEMLFINKIYIQRDQLELAMAALRAIGDVELPKQCCSGTAKIYLDGVKRRSLPLALRLDFFSGYAAKRAQENAKQARERIDMHVSIKNEISALYDVLSVVIGELEKCEPQWGPYLVTVESEKPE